MTGHLRVLAATALLAATASAPPAQANPTVGTFLVHSEGTFAPELHPATVQTRSLRVAGTATIVGTDGVLLMYTCEFLGVETGTLAGGVGTLGGGCGPITCSSLAWVRVGPDANLTCDAPRRLPTLACFFRPHQTPATTFDLVCGGNYARGV